MATAQTKPRAWDHYSGVSDCDTCDGRGDICNPPRGAYNYNPLEWQEECPDCDGLGMHVCQVCGFEEVVKGYDCLVCATVAELTPAQMREINPADLADCFAAAVNAALNHGGEA
jgi:DnaJ-class molecular chaperone